MRNPWGLLWVGHQAVWTSAALCLAFALAAIGIVGWRCLPGAHRPRLRATSKVALVLSLLASGGLVLLVLFGLFLLPRLFPPPTERSFDLAGGAGLVDQRFPLMLGNSCHQFELRWPSALGTRSRRVSRCNRWDDGWYMTVKDGTLTIHMDRGTRCSWRINLDQKRLDLISDPVCDERLP